MLSRQKDVPPPEAEAAPAPARDPRVWRVWNVSTPTSRVDQFVHGLCLPFHLVRVLLEDREVRGSYLKVGITQAAVTLALALWFTGSSGEEVVKNVRFDAWDRRFVYWAALYSSLQVAQWIVIALSRDYHTALARELSLRLGLEPEDEPLTPRVRLNTGWLRKKLRHRWQALVVFSLGVPVLWAGSRFLPGGRLLFPALLSVWGAWWFVVYTAGKSARAWAETEPREPWFLRGWKALPTRLPLFRWTPFGMYGSLWTNFTRPVFSPAASVERRPWVLGGLAVARALAVLPLVKCFLRPVIPVAATRLLVTGEAPSELGVSPPGAASAPAPAPAPSSAAPPPHPPAASRPTG